MLRSKYTTALCVIVTAAMLVTTALFMAGETLGLTAAHSVPLYVGKLFSTDKVHEIDISVGEEDWQEMLDNALSKEYIMCDVVIDGNTVKNVAIRPKGNSSLSSIASSDTDRYSFKLEFDHYNKTQTYYGLDKLALNNITQDNTYLKDYVSYQMMNAFEADAPLSSFIYIKVNGEDWGLYLAVEGIEESFAQRNYGTNYGEIYKPDSMDMVAGRGNNTDATDGSTANGQSPGNFKDGEIPVFPQDGQAWQDGGRQRPDFTQGAQNSDGTQMDGQSRFPQGGQFSGEGETLPDGQTGNTQTMPEFPASIIGEDGMTEQGDAFQNWGGNIGGGRGAMGSGSSDVALQYSDNNIESYPNIFDNAVFDPTEADENRLIASIKAMNEGDMQSSVNVDEVLRYFVVHNFVLNFDSYTGSMLHNYYLYEEDGLLSMIAWDYNLAFGAFSMGNNVATQTADSASTLINYPIDTPTSGTTMENIPLLNNLLTDEKYLEQYHGLFSQFISEYFDSGEFEKMYDNAVTLISPYVEKDPTAFCTYDEFQKAQDMLKQFCLLRAESVKGQLDGTIARTAETQSSTQNAGFIDASGIDINAMGSSMSGFGRGRGRTNTQDAAAAGALSVTPPNMGQDIQTGELSGTEESTAAARRQNGQNNPSGGMQPSPPEGLQVGQSGREKQNADIGAGEKSIQKQETTGWADKQTFILLAISGGLSALGLIIVKFYKV